MTKRIPAISETATAAYRLVTDLQQRFVQRLQRVAQSHGQLQRFTTVEWLRDEGRHGGGIRLETADGPMIGRGSVNVSQVHYDDRPDRGLGSANALSTIIHPVHPHAPSVHIHISWMEQKTGAGYWRMMADLNPAIENPAATKEFIAALRTAAPEQFDRASAQGDRYFFIPVLGRHRGVAHFYLEGYCSGDFEADRDLAGRVGRAAIDTYVTILDEALEAAGEPTHADIAAQIGYHTLYFFQVLTLDRGTTTGLMVHDQNDIGIMGSLPPRIDRNLLESWRKRMPSPQEQLLSALIGALPHENPCPIEAATKQRLADAVREHYRTHPEALAMQASGEVTPPTVENHI